MRLWIILALAGGILVGGTGCDKLGLGSSKDKASKEDDDDSDSKKDKKKKKKKKSDDDDDDSDKSDKSDKKADKDKDKKDDKASDPAPTPTPTPTPAASGKFAGVYRSTWGDVRIREEGGKVECTYPAGTMSCTPNNLDLDCDWKEGSTKGKAKLKKQSNGDIDGTWGNGMSATDGGRWLFTLLSAGDPGPSGNEAAAGSFAGVYVSTWGDTTFTENGSNVKGKYPGGVLDCTSSGANLDCSWREGSGSGKARLTRQLSGDISGTWGNGASATDGGSWLFRKK
jgi:hypothetical protein